MEPSPFLIQTKKTLSKSLPQQLDETINSYSYFAKIAPPEDAKGFAAHHSACKAALAHLDQLIKLAHWVEDQPPSVLENEDAEAERLVQKAQQAVAEIKDND
ncbi:MAG: hypothetical protein OQK35_01750 [Alphaproteobacteria bacterium]|nr:hypothetical protein [Rhodospirillales bacterium]MCW9045032.1 hypothetical protein [Alphaproteobacteria bacterium]